MSERHFHGTRHFKGGFDALGQELTPADKIAIKREVIVSLETSANDFPQFADGLLARVKVLEAEIAALQIESDNLSACVPAGWIESPEVYDFTPFPKEMPDIDFETVDEIPF